MKFFYIMRMSFYSVFVVLCVVLIGLHLFQNYMFSYEESFVKDRLSSDPRDLEQIESTNDMNTTVWIVWFQGWDNAPWLQKQVANSWKVNNPTWNIQLLDMNRLKELIPEETVLFDETNDVTMAAKSDIVRLALLYKFGGVWADSTLLCMQPLDSWVTRALAPCGFWMYHGLGSNMDKSQGPASWFIVSKKGSYIISKWKEKCDEYWKNRKSTDNYFWMDSLFKQLYESDAEFSKKWDSVPYLYCNDDGSSHTFEKYDPVNNDSHIQELLNNKPPFALKLWNKFSHGLENCKHTNKPENCEKSNGYQAIQFAQRGNVAFDHFSGVASASA